MAGRDPVRLERAAALCQGYVDSGQMPCTSLLVARHGEIAMRRDYGLMDVAEGKPLARSDDLRKMRENMRSTQQFMSTIKGTTQQPRERYGRPQTSSHDVGWDARPLTPRNPRFQANRRMCAETVYANKYTMMTGIGPYSPR